MRKKRLACVVAAAGLGAVGTLHAVDVAACSCDTMADILPRDGAVVPSNTKIWFVGHSIGCSSPELRDSSDAVVAADLRLLGERLRMLDPTAELQLGESYTAYCADYRYETFTVEGGPDDAAPGVPVATVGDSESNSTGDSCGEWGHVTVDVSHDGDMLLLDVAGEATLDVESWTGGVVDVFLYDFVYVGTAVCSGNWDFDDKGEATDVRWASLDLSGNFSGWSAPEDLDVGCGCRLAGSRTPPVGASWVVLALAAIAWGRRRAARSARQ